MEMKEEEWSLDRESLIRTLDMSLKELSMILEKGSRFHSSLHIHYTDVVSRWLVH